MWKNKIMTLFIISVLLILPFGVNALTLTKDQFITLTDQQIANYMQNNFYITSYNFDDDTSQLYIYYNVVKVKQNKNETIKIYNENVGTYVYYKDIIYCLNYYSAEICVNNLVHGEDILNVSIDGVITKILPSYYQAYQIGLQEYYSTLIFRDKMISRTQLSNFENLMGGLNISQ
jgi:hypothetical protein